ncbi:hypothetical protein SAMN04487950_4050 [Halogranum rubrum]|uniref:CRISPR-associated protein (Cas_Cas02710) n=1 Tax=Halogranum rubrum TaxID=553466 RepID=A0A1I4I8Q6_9EURY|nr:DUF6293 family protein [Halogranum rubrum]SFL50700.1 hypothetical protein SAMN04487950_4050 [Halogranum rubrum]
MGLSVRERIHIMPMGYEVERIVLPAENFRADKVEVVTHTENDPEADECLELVEEGLSQRNIDYEIHRCDIFNLYESLGKIAELIFEHEDDDVYVNVSAGSKVTAIAGMIASMVMGSTAYYGKAETYKERPSGIGEVAELPSYPIDAPASEQVTVMEYIHRYLNQETVEEPPTKGDIIHFSERAGLPYIRRNVAGKGKYRLLDTDILEPLMERGWVDVTKQGRNKVISISRDGEAALNAFRWMVDVDQNWDILLSDEQED